jgi:hypothetical protein
MTRPTVYEESRVATNLRLPRSLHEKVKAAAQERGVAVNWLLTRLIMDGMDRLIPVDELTLVRPLGKQEDR